MKMLVAVIAACACLGWTGAVQAAPDGPDAERAAVLSVVNAFFDAMRTRDAAAMRRLYQPRTQFVFGAPAKDGYALDQESIEDFIPEAQSAPDAYRERTWAETVLVDGRVAVVWARYDFHRGARFSHNGRDCYVLMKTDQGWKIVSLVFSVEPAEHTENPSGPPR